MKRAFTLIEVNLAMLIMAGGILSIVGLYGFGFRESAQSREDVEGAALADAVVGPLVMVLQDTANDWNNFRDGFTLPSKGWEAYMDNDYNVSQSPTDQARTAYNAILNKFGTTKSRLSFPDGAVSSSGLGCGLVIHHEKGSAVVTIAFRAVDKNRPNTLMSQPIYYTEARFQGKSYE